MIDQHDCKKDHENIGLSSILNKHFKKFFDAHSNDCPAKNVYVHIIKEVEKPLIKATLDYVGGNQLKASKVLGISRNTLRKKINELDISL